MIHIIDDDIAIQTSLKLLVNQAGFESLSFSHPDEYISAKTTKPDLVLLDMNFSNATTGEEGMSFLLQLKHIYTHVPVILITAWGTIPLAVEGVKQGAFDFITKPWNNVALLQIINTAIKLTEPSESSKTRAQLDKKFSNSVLII